MGFLLGRAVMGTMISLFIIKENYLMGFLLTQQVVLPSLKLSTISRSDKISAKQLHNKGFTIVRTHSPLNHFQQHLSFTSISK